jgi:hypothetical protein
MTTKPDDLLPKASDLMKKLAVAEAEEASKQAGKMAAADAEKKSLIDHLREPSGVSDEEGIRRAVRIIERAVSNGVTEVQVTVSRTSCAPTKAAPSISRRRAGKTR